MANINAGFKGINDIAVRIHGSFDRYKGTPEIFRHLDSAGLKIINSGSMKKYKFVEDIRDIRNGFTEANKAVDEVSAFLEKVLELYEACEAKLVSRLGDYIKIESLDEAWVEDSLNVARNNYSEYGGVLGAAFGYVGWDDALLATGKDGTYGIDACFAAVSTKKTTRNDLGQRVTTGVDFQLLCLKSKYAFGVETDAGTKYGLDIALNVGSLSFDRKKDANLFSGGGEIGFGEGVTLMYTSSEKGPDEVSSSVPKTPISLTLRD